MKQRVLWVLRVVAVGLVANLLIAYMLAMLVPFSQGFRPASRTPDAGWRDALPAALQRPDTAPHGVHFARNAAITYWQIVHEGPTATTIPSDYVAHIFRVGFPFRCFEAWTLSLGRGNTLGYTGPVNGLYAHILWRRSLFMVTGRSYLTWMPLGPLWAGLLGNSLFYGAIVWALFAAAQLARAARRRRKGLCPRCAYPVGPSTVCSECGHPVSAGPATSPSSAGR